MVKHPYMKTRSIQVAIVIERKLKEEWKTMDRNMNATRKRGTGSSLFVAACIIALLFQIFTASPAVAATTLTALWTAGGLSAGNDSAGQAARIATDASGNVAVVSGPALARDLAVTSYTADGAFRWRGTVSPVGGNVRRETGWSLRPTAISWRSVTTSTSRGQSDRQHHGPLRLRRDAPVAGGLRRGILPFGWRGSWSMPRATPTWP